MNRFELKPVVAAVALAIASVSAYADPTPNQLPGAGLIRAVNTGTTISSPALTWLVSGGGAAGGEVYNGTLAVPFYPGSIQLNNAGTVARAVIRWGGNGASLETFNPQGFNIGSNASVYFTSSATVTDAAVLNIDASGNASQIFGKMISTDAVVGGSGGGAAPKVFLANANGIIIGAGGEYQIPNGGGLIGANMDTNTIAYEFVGNNGAATSFVDVFAAGGVAKIVNNGYIYGGTVGLNTNAPAKYVLLVGGDIVNAGTGNIFGSYVQALAGIRNYQSATTSDTVNGVSKVSVQRLFNIDAQAWMISGYECTSGPICVEISKSGAVFTNDGTVSSAGGAIQLFAAKGIRSGTLGSTNPTIGLFFDDFLTTNVYEAGGNTELYNIVGRYNETPGVYNSYVLVNAYGGWDGDVTINALTRASAPSSITTNNGVGINGVNVNINSTIDHTVHAGANGNLNIQSTNSVSITKGVGAGDDVNITNSGAGGINISGNITSDNDAGGAGQISIVNTGAGSPTTISGNVTAGNLATTPNEPVIITVNGPLNITGPVRAYTGDILITNNSKSAATVISGNDIQTGSFGDIHIVVNANLDVNSLLGPTATPALPTGNLYIDQNSLSSATTTTIAGLIVAHNVYINNNAGTGSKLNVDASILSVDYTSIYSHGSLREGSITAGGNVDITVDGLNVMLTGPIKAGNVGYGAVDIDAVNAQTKVTTDAIITANEVYLEVLNFRGVRNDGTDYTATSQKPAAQIVTDNLYLTSYGSFNSPLTQAANPLNDWLKNSMWVKPLSPGAQVDATLSAVGAGFQAINLGVRGDAAIDSGITLTPFFLTGYSTPSILPPFLGANLGSSLIVQTEGNLDIYSGSIPGFASQFLFPGGVAFKAGGYLAVNTNVNNAIASTQQYPFSGQWFESATIIDSGYHATNPGSRINYSSYPLTGMGTAYWLAQPTPGLYQFVNTPEARFYNVYSTAILGGAICNVANPPAPWPPAGC